MAALPQDVFPKTVGADALSALQDAVRGFDRDQLIWSSGFLAGLAGVANGAAADAVALPPAEPRAAGWTVFYASETGNSRRVAEALVAKSREAGIDANLIDLREVRPRQLANTESAVFVLATHGIGEPPEGTEPFFEFWESSRAPRLEQLDFGVIALGDSGYADFCEVGRRFERRLRDLGAKPVLERVDCDVDFDRPATDWTDRFVRQAAVTAVAAPAAPTLRAVPPPAISRENPYTAGIVTAQKITGRHSSKDVRHIELDLADSGISYLPGDALGVMPVNPPALIEQLLEQTGLDGDAVVRTGERDLSLGQALRKEREITQLSRPMLEAVAEHQPDLLQILGSRERLARYLATRQLTDLIAEYPRQWTPQLFVDSLRALTPRLYSIASSPDANPGEAHLTVRVVRYESDGREHWGCASTFLAASDTAPVYVEANERFRLPGDSDRPVIMIAAGTGIAPFRAFVEHRREHGHRGANWLIYGDRTFREDFLYQTEWLRYRKQGVVTRMDLAFSRDQADRVYVQQRLAERSRDVYGWLADGAHVYVCGDAERMAVAVEDTLAGILSEAGGLSAEDASAYLATLRTEGRYQRDVY